MSSTPQRSERIRLVSFTVKPDRIVAQVEVPVNMPRETTPELMDAVIERFPDLPRHTCVNDTGSLFSAVMDHTGIPHLLEHMVIDLQTKQCPDPNRVFRGSTTWIRRGQGTARIEMSFSDDLVALRAFKDAAEFLNRLN